MQCHAQVADTGIIQQQLEQELERVIERSESSESMDNFSTIEDAFLIRTGQKLNINTATYEELMAGGLFSDLISTSIISYRKNYGAFKSVNELQSVYGMDRDAFLAVLPYITIDENISNSTKSFASLFGSGKHQILTRYRLPIQKAEGYIADTLGNTKYLGNNQTLFLRYRYAYANLLSYGFTIEKDAGEKLWNKDVRSKFDYLSGHLFIAQRKWLYALALGDFQANWGQGLISWQGYGIGKGGDPIRIKRNGKAIQPHASANEILFYRGVGSTLKFGNVYITGLFSYRKRDANVIFTDTLEDDLDNISSLQTSGYHRTPSELADRYSVHVMNAGTRIQYRGTRMNFGGNFLYTRLDKPLQTSDELYNKYDFRGQTLLNGSVDYSYLFNKWHIFGEAAINNNDYGFAVVNGAMVKPVPGVSLSILHRYYSPKYYSLYGDSFSENSTPANENGMYIGATFSPIKNFKVESYFDFFVFPWLKFGVDKPNTNGIDIYTQLTWTPVRSTRIYTRIRYETKDANVSDPEAIIDYVAPIKALHTRLHIDFNPNAQWSLRTRFEYSQYDDSFNPKEKGYLLFQDIGWETKKSVFGLNTRFCIFETDSYNSRIYTYESDVLYAFSVPAFYGRGYRFYLMTKFRITSHMDLWLRYAQTYYPDQSTVGSGFDLLNSNQRSEFKAQLRLKF
jgi:DNA uptake protein ComE-like DNA-binding protein